MAKRSFLIALCAVLLPLAVPAFLSAQGIVTYRLKVNGKERPQQSPFILSYKKGIALLNPGGRRGKEQQYLDYNRKAVFKNLATGDQTYTVRTPFDSLQRATLLSDTATIAGYLCHKAELVIRSNHIEVWYTDALPLKGSPSPEVAPYLGLVLKMVRNGNVEMTASHIAAGPVPDSLWRMPAAGQLVDEAAFQARLIQSRYTAVPVFTDQKINFGDSTANPPGEQADKVYRFSGGSVAVKKIHLPEHFRGHVFAAVTQYSEGDAYDRTGCVFVIPAGGPVSFLDALQKGINVLPVYKDHAGNAYQGIAASGQYMPPAELMRFFTPFGVKAYNDKVKIAGYHWADSVTFVQDVTDVLPLLQGEAWIGIYIGNYDKNGHRVSLKLNYYPDDAGDDSGAPGKPWMLPLFNTLNIMEMSGQNYGRLFDNDSLSVRVFVPDSIEHLRLRYLSTGHGGWGGGDEFNPKVNTILLDGVPVFSYTPWRTDCGTYRMSNPSSGNFGDGLSSSDYSRSGWCPGTATDPVYIPLPSLEPGWHTFTVAIPEGAREGDSFSFWNVSGCLTGTLKK